MKLNYMTIPSFPKINLELIELFTPKERCVHRLTNSVWSTFDRFMFEKVYSNQFLCCFSAMWIFGCCLLTAPCGSYKCGYEMLPIFSVGQTEDDLWDDESSDASCCFKSGSSCCCCCVCGDSLCIPNFVHRWLPSLDYSQLLPLMFCAEGESPYDDV